MMNIRRDTLQALPELLYREERIDLAAAFRWAARLNMHEAVASHFSLAVDSAGKRFLINPNQRHFSLIKASDLLLLDADDPGVPDRRDAPDPTAWGLARTNPSPLPPCPLHYAHTFNLRDRADLSCRQYFACH